MPQVKQCRGCQAELDAASREDLCPKCQPYLGVTATAATPFGSEARAFQEKLLHRSRPVHDLCNAPQKNRELNSMAFLPIGPLEADHEKWKVAAESTQKEVKGCFPFFTGGGGGDEKWNPRGHELVHAGPSAIGLIPFCKTFRKSCKLSIPPDLLFWAFHERGPLLHFRPSN